MQLDFFHIFNLSTILGATAFVLMSLFFTWIESDPSGVNENSFFQIIFLLQTLVF